MCWDRIVDAESHSSTLPRPEPDAAHALQAPSDPSAMSEELLSVPPASGAALAAASA